MKTLLKLYVCVALHLLLQISLDHPQHGLLRLFDPKPPSAIYKKATDQTEAERLEIGKYRVRMSRLPIGVGSVLAIPLSLVGTYLIFRKRKKG